MRILGRKRKGRELKERKIDGKGEGGEEKRKEGKKR